ncbi:polyphosphate polymerase domain-containing protein [bacterium]|nr:polyphosphate polymerase domain-containing protein [bacterium]
MERFERKELKYLINNKHRDELRQRFMVNMQHDSFCCDIENKAYTVRSIYLDTRSYLFYFEKKDGLKIRKKLRIRTYNNSQPNNAGFLEIKRKHGNTVFKERVRINLSETPNILNGAELHPTGSDTHIEKIALNRFIYLTKRLKLEPKTLITYEREALIGLDDPMLRVTFDMNLRSYSQPNIEEFLREKDMRSIENSHFVLEIKFDSYMPVWIRHIIRDFGLRVQAISKYCHGLEVWHPNTLEPISIV